MFDRCEGAVKRIEHSALGTVFICSHGAPKHSMDGCRRTYLSHRDLQAHIIHRHSHKPLPAATTDKPLLEGELSSAAQHHTVFSTYVKREGVKEEEIKREQDAGQERQQMELEHQTQSERQIQNENQMQMEKRMEVENQDKMVRERHQEIEQGKHDREERIVEMAQVFVRDNKNGRDLNAKKARLVVEGTREREVSQVEDSDMRLMESGGYRTGMARSASQPVYRPLEDCSSLPVCHTIFPFQPLTAHSLQRPPGAPLLPPSLHTLPQPLQNSVPQAFPQPQYAPHQATGGSYVSSASHGALAVVTFPSSVSARTNQNLITVPIQDEADTYTSKQPPVLDANNILSNSAVHPSMAVPPPSTFRNPPPTHPYTFNLPPLIPPPRIFNQVSTPSMISRIPTQHNLPHGHVTNTPVTELIQHSSVLINGASRLPACTSTSYHPAQPLSQSSSMLPSQVRPLSKHDIFPVNQPQQTIPHGSMPDSHVRQATQCDIMPAKQILQVGQPDYTSTNQLHYADQNCNLPACQSQQVNQCGGMSFNQMPQLGAYNFTPIGQRGQMPQQSYMPSTQSQQLPPRGMVPDTRFQEFNQSRCFPTNQMQPVAKLSNAHSDQSAHLNFHRTANQTRPLSPTGNMYAGRSKQLPLRSFTPMNQAQNVNQSGHISANLPQQLPMHSHLPPRQMGPLGPIPQHDYIPPIQSQQSVRHDQYEMQPLPNCNRFSLDRNQQLVQSEQTHINQSHRMGQVRPLPGQVGPLPPNQGQLGQMQTVNADHKSHLPGDRFPINNMPPHVRNYHPPSVSDLSSHSPLCQPPFPSNTSPLQRWSTPPPTLQRLPPLDYAPRRFQNNKSYNNQYY